VVRQPEVTAAKTTIKFTRGRLDPWPDRFIADTGYGSVAELAGE
jgi:hypothetical protein